jgi:hypothetical protein
MTDTPPEIRKLVHDRLMALSGEERFLMGARMFESARTIILASLPKDLSAEELRRKLFERIYGKKLEDFIT